MKSDGIGNKIILIAMLCAALGLFLYLRPRLFAPEPLPRMIDRLPESDILGRFYLLDIARETSSMMYYHKIPFRDVLSYEFLLSQGKSYGLDIQKPGYFFSNEEGEWGLFLHVTDSSRIPSGLLRLNQFTSIEDSILHERKIHYFREQNLSLYYDHNYLFLYHGDNLDKHFSRVIYAKNGDEGNNWKKFNSLTTFKTEKLAVFSNSKKLDKYGVDYCLFAHDTDSLSFKLKSYVKMSRDLKVKMKEPGLALAEIPQIEKLLNLHLDISEFKKDKEQPLYQWIVEIGRKVSFPTEAFFDAWTGDLSFQQGGTQMAEEELIETVYDDEFNMTEVRTTKLVPIPGFSVLISVNENGRSFVNSLFAKGIITKQGGNKYRFLFSPPLKMNIKPTFVSGYSGKSPKLSTSSSCAGVWNYKGTKVAFQVDSMTQREVFGSMQFPVNRLLRRNKFF